MAENLLIFAGRKAYSIIREQGLRPESVEVVAGAAGGPKWLVLDGLDRAIFFSWLAHHNRPLHLVGSSIGAWRFAAIAQGRKIDAYDSFSHAYIHQSYSARATPQEVSREGIRILDTYLNDEGIREILNHPYMRLNVLTVYCRWPFSQDRSHTLGLALLGAGIMNCLSRKSLGLFFTRSLFYDPRALPPFFATDRLPTQRIPLTEQNIRAAVLASGSIPVVMSGVKDIPGSPSGMYRDGGIIDYHLNIPFNCEGIVLFPHYLDHIIPGWFDKRLPWRKPDPRNLDNVVLLCPSREFVDKLPYRKIPDRNDFKHFRRRSKERISYWNRVVKESSSLGDEFLEIVRGRGIQERLRPLPRK